MAASTKFVLVQEKVNVLVSVGRKAVKLTEITRKVNCYQ